MHGRLFAISYEVRGPRVPAVEVPDWPHGSGVKMKPEGRSMIVDNQENSTVRFTVDLPRDLVDAVDAHRIEMAERAERAAGTKLKVSRNAALEALVRLGLGCVRSPKF